MSAAEKIPPKMNVQPISNDGMLNLQFSKEMKYPESWHAKYAKDKETLKNIDKARRLEEKEDDDDLKISVLTNKNGKLFESEDQKVEWLIVELEPKAV